MLMMNRVLVISNHDGVCEDNLIIGRYTVDMIMMMTSHDKIMMRAMVN